MWLYKQCGFFKKTKKTKEKLNRIHRTEVFILLKGKALQKAPSTRLLSVMEESIRSMETDSDQQRGQMQKSAWEDKDRERRLI